MTEETSEESAATPAEEQVLEACPACATLMDVSDVVPFTEICCPSCGQTLRARRQFNNFTLIEQIGEGGMGSVFKALDTNLNRHVALKILKKEISANAEERAKLAEEARMTANINHPHVVKVYNFGQDRGQFYIAMELVEKGSLDQLMTVQRRVAEAQMLEVGIQIAQGLEAALGCGLIHRDIKPGNILFAEAHTAKLVDFGLAIVMDQEAQVRGEIWGTPYYIAPEKLDNLPEDFRSDIYSLGGTMFHALAGRPPYEAETASMVALKQLKSQQVSLQAFAPDVSSETAYVINRMMAKNPEDRYQSYEELIGHLQYAREKLLERTRKPLQPKQRVVLETEETRKFSALLSLGVLAALLVTGLVVFLMRDHLFPSDKTQTPAAEKVDTRALQSSFESAVTMLASGDVDGARAEFHRLSNASTPQPLRNWAILNASLAAMMTGDSEAALADLQPIQEMYASNPAKTPMDSFFAETARFLQKNEVLPASMGALYTQPSDAFALLIFGVFDWESKQSFSDASTFLRAFAQMTPSDVWITQYQPLVKKYLEDWKLLRPIEYSLTKATTPDKAQELLKKVREAQGKIQSGSRAAEYLDTVAKRLEAVHGPATCEKPSLRR